MRERFRYTPLIQARRVRVEQALAGLQAARERAAKRQAEREETEQRWRLACASRAAHQEQRTAWLASESPAPVAQRLVQWERHGALLADRIELARRQLLEAEARLAEALAQVATELAAWRRATRKLDALLHLQAEWRAECGRRQARGEEQAAEDRVFNRYALSRP